MGVDLKKVVDIQAEAGVIATVICHPDYILHSDYLRPKYFYDVNNACIYWAIEELYKKGVDNIDALNISNMLNSHPAVKKQIQNSNIGNLQEFISMSQYAARHSLNEYKLLVNRVVEMSFKRELINVTTEIQSDCYSDMDLGKLNQVVNNKLSGLTEKYITGDEIKLLGEEIDEIWAKYENQDISRRLPSTFKAFNEYFYYEPGELILLTARYKTGKSVFCMHEACNMIKMGIPTLYVDTELSTEVFVKRMISHLTGIPFKAIQNHYLTKDQDVMVKKCIDWIHTIPFVHMYLPDSNMDEIYSICKMLKYKINLQFFVYDYIKSYNSEAYTNSAILGQMADFLKNKIAGELDLAVLSAAQLNRNDMIANSDNIAKAISTGIYWRFKTPEEMNNDGPDAGNVMAYININRNGPQTNEDEAIFFNFDGDHQRITEAKLQKKDVPSMATPFG